MKFYIALSSICLCGILGATVVYSSVSQAICGEAWCSGVGGIAAGVLALLGGLLGMGAGLIGVLVLARHSRRGQV